MSKWKLQAIEPDTCDSPPCRYIELWDVEAAPESRTHTVVAFERVCTAHADTVPTGKILWADGNWKPWCGKTGEPCLRDPNPCYMKYQRQWFLRLNHVEWLARFPNGEQPLPDTIAPFTSDPLTTGSVAAPAQAERDGMGRAYGRNKEHNARKNQAITIPGAVRANFDATKITWSYSGVGDARVLTVNTGGQLTTQQRTQAQNIADIQFGSGRVMMV